VFIIQKIKIKHTSYIKQLHSWFHSKSKKKKKKDNHIFHKVHKLTILMSVVFVDQQWWRWWLYVHMRRVIVKYVGLAKKQWRAT
jgi:hypothetical protein